MESESGPRGPSPWRPRLALGMALLALAGFVDALGVCAFGLFPAFMSGDTTNLALAPLRADGVRAPALAGVVVLFVTGAFLGRLVRLHTARRWPVLALEAGVLGIAAMNAHAGIGLGALSCAVAAMGMQATVLTHAGAMPVGATYVTGTLARLGAGLADALAGARDGAWAAQLLLWISLAAGAAGGGLCYGRFGLDSLLVAAVACAALAAATGLRERRGDTGRTA